MAKKKKKLELTWMHYLPGVQFTNAINTPMPSIGHPELEPLDIPVPSTPYGNTDSPHSMLGAFAQYTGIPAMLAGGMGALGFNVATQAGQVRTGTSIFAAAKFGFTGALILEASVGTLLFATVMTAVDPGHQWSGGLDSPRFHQHEHVNPFTTGNFTHPRSGYTPQPL